MPEVEWWICLVLAMPIMWGCGYAYGRSHNCEDHRDGQ